MWIKRIFKKLVGSKTTVEKTKVASPTTEKKTPQHLPITLRAKKGYVYINKDGAHGENIHIGGNDKASNWKLIKKEDIPKQEEL